MKAIDRELLNERNQVLETHLGRIGQALPAEPLDFKLGSDAADVVSLHVFLAVQVVLDLSIFACLHFGLQAPASYDDAVARLAHADRIHEDLADRLEKAATFRDAFVHAYDQLDAATIYQAARTLPGDLRLFMADIAVQAGG